LVQLSNTDNYFDNGNGYSNRNNNGFGESAAQGMGSGVGSAFKTLADFYIDMAKDLYPVIEVKGGREVQILVKGGKQITEAPYNKLFVNTDYEISLNNNISIDY
jgi:hemoglobin-like flavoprotein